MKIRKVLRGSLLILAWLSATLQFAQQNSPWTLRQCIDYARQNNIQIKQQKLSAELYHQDILQSKAALFPSLSVSSSQQLGHAQTMDANGDYRYQTSTIGQYAMTASWTIYNGRRNVLALKQAELQKNVQNLSVEEQQNSIEIAIAQAYLQILYYREAVKNNQNLLETSLQSLEQARLFLQAGTITRADLAQVEADYSTSKYNLVTAQNSYDLNLLQLKQLLELNPEDTLSIAFPNIAEEEIVYPVPSKDAVYAIALQAWPTVESSKQAIDIAKLSRQSAKGGYWPTISLGGSLASSAIYSQSPSVRTQLDRNFSQTVGITFTLPIFDNRQNKTNVAKAKINLLTAELALIDSQKALLRTIEGLYQDAIAAQSKYLAAKEVVIASKESYEILSEQYLLGLKNTVELVTQKNNYANALQSLLQAKYTAILSLKLLKFYQGEPITL